MRLTLVFLAGLSAALRFSVPPVEGTEWVESRPYPLFSHEQCTGGKIDGNHFYIPKSPNLDRSGPGCNNGHLRAQRRYHNDYSSGVHQFGGAFTINSVSDTRIAIRQIVDEGRHQPYFTLWAGKWGKLYGVDGYQFFARHIANVGKAVRLNTVHDVEKGRISLYIDGKEIYRDTRAPRGSFYDKIGAYVTDKSPGGMNITWDYVQFWHK
ncbi:hypothetical protein E4U60_004506 [Claviceps pazoutovae]|uniref:Alginate lyase 2 domain-containing protein n=1 Tax=Claviceps pazoutovae TaxID=1649127 RepID=A0A9P7M8S7_9HYPO|nr:hypothetical protein E4U60_004506 [Claviceps pazoutovae]